MWLEETTDKYPQIYSLEFHQNDYNVLDAFKEGDQVECGINLRGRHWQKDGREGVMSTPQCWRIKWLSAAIQQQQETVAQQDTAPAEEVADDLPF